MAYSVEQKRKMLERSRPESDAVREILADYLSRSGLTISDFGRRIDYAGSSLRLFTEGRYAKIAGDDSSIRDAILDFIHTHPVATDQECEGGTLYPTRDVNLLRRYFYEALDKGWAYYVYGAPGTQKTYTVQHLIAELNRQEISKNGHGRRAFYVYCRDGIRPTDLLKRVTEASGAPTAGSADRILRNFRFDFRGRRVLLVFDEAHHLDSHCLETVRELIDRPPYCGLLFQGSHNLNQIFIQYDLEQWSSRIHAGKSLPGIDEKEAREIIASEIPTLAAKQTEVIIKHARVADPRQGKDYTYISARKLFWSLRDIKTALAEKRSNP